MGQEYSIVIQNNTHSTIRCNWSNKYPVDSVHALRLMPASLDIIAQGRSVELHYTTEKYMSWKGVFYDSEAGYLSIYICDDEIVKTNDKEALQKDYLVLVRYDFTQKQLEQDLNWQISFPPNEMMKDVHMWPPYEVVVAQYSK